VNTKETNILYSGRKYFKLRLGNLDTGLQVRDKTLKYRNGYLVKSCKDLQSTKSKKGSHQRKNEDNTNNFGKTGQQHVEMV
jgi:hypothetical protein